MQIDPMEDWRRLSIHYAQMTDSELLNLAEDFQDLTHTARQVLRNEMEKRGLDHLQEIKANDPEVAQDRETRDPAPETIWVWKNLLCECNDQEQAQRISEVLRQANIESWIEGSSSYSPYLQGEMSRPRLRV